MTQDSRLKAHGSSLYFRQISVGYMGNFIYLIGDKKAGECAMVDPAWDVDTVLKEAEKDGMKVVAGILTHTHFDHANGVGALVEKTGAKIYVHEHEAKYLTPQGVFSEGVILSEAPSGAKSKDLKPIKMNIVETKEGSKLKIGDVEMVFLHTPGHAEGAQCILVGDKLVTGDTLFVGACGRCDLPGGDEKKMMQSLKRLAGLDGSLQVFPGHSYGDENSSTLGSERRTNPYMKF